MENVCWALWASSVMTVGLVALVVVTGIVRAVGNAVKERKF